MAVNPDFKELFSAFNDAGVEYLVVGAHAVMFYTRPRFTKDLDLWVNPTRRNAPRVWQALTVFGAPLQNLTIGSFTERDLIYQIGVAPNRVDILTDIAGLAFLPSWKRRERSTYGGVPIPILGAADLTLAKAAAGRPQDRRDIAELKRRR